MWRERRDMVAMWKAGQCAALASIVSVDGSSYRKPGARLMLGIAGEQVGSISGGCLEADVIRKMRWLVRSGPQIQKYSSVFDDTSDIPFGFGCGGEITLLLEAANTREFRILMESMEHSVHGRDVDLWTQLPIQGREFIRTTVGSDERVSSDSAFSLERLIAIPRLYIFGAGNDAQPLAIMADSLGWLVHVIDMRAQWARPERFPRAECVAVADAKTSDGLQIGPTDFAVIMTHSYEQDRHWLCFLSVRKPRYIGLLGAKKRSELLVKEVSASLRLSTDRVMKSLFAPIGLDLGGDGSEAIALSIMAQVHAFAERKQIATGPFCLVPLGSLSSAEDSSTNA